MLSVIESAKRGNIEAMTELYNSTKSKVSFLCESMLGKSKSTNKVIMAIFMESIDEIAEGKVESENQYRDIVYKKTALRCWQSIQPEIRSFESSVDKDFSKMYCNASNITTQGEPIDIILNNLPMLHKFICLLRYIFDFTKQDISNIVKMDTNTVGIIIDADEIQVKRIIGLASEKLGKNVSITPEMYHDEIRKKADNFRTPARIDKVILENINIICTELCKKKKKKRIKNSAISLGLFLLVICLLKFKM